MHYIYDGWQGDYGNRFVYTCPPKDTLLEDGDYVFILSNSAPYGCMKQFQSTPEWFDSHGNHGKSDVKARASCSGFRIDLDTLYVPKFCLVFLDRHVCFS